MKVHQRIGQLEDLKPVGGPFTCAEELNVYQSDMTVLPEIKQKRLKKEVQFARDSCTTLPKASPLFKVPIVQGNKKRRDKTADEFAVALTVYLGKKEDWLTMPYGQFVLYWCMFTHNTVGLQLI